MMKQQGQQWYEMVSHHRQRYAWERVATVDICWGMAGVPVEIVNSFTGIACLLATHSGREDSIWSFLFLMCLCIFLVVLGLSGYMQDLYSSLWHMGSLFCCSIWNLVPLQGLEPRPPALGAHSFSHWTTRKVTACGLDFLEIDNLVSKEFEILLLLLFFLCYIICLVFLNLSGFWTSRKEILFLTIFSPVKIGLVHFYFCVSLCLHRIYNLRIYSNWNVAPKETC